MRNISNHSFNIQLATEIGVDAAILLGHIAYWVQYNQNSGKNEHDGKFWMYQTQQEMAAHFPYWGRDKIQKLLAKLEKDGWIVKANHNRVKFDKTHWYSLGSQMAQSNVPNGTIDSEDPHNGECQPAQPIPKSKDSSKDSSKEENIAQPPKKSAKPRSDFSFSQESGKFEGLKDNDLSDWEIAYPAIDIRQEIVKAEQWLKSNPSKAKAKKLWRKFLVGWFVRANEKAENQAAYRSQKNTRANPNLTAEERSQYDF